MTTTTKTNSRPRVSAEDRKAQAEALHENITAQVEALRDSVRWTQFLEFASAFHNYSLGNLLLILSQCPDASHVAGFRTWQSVDRQVRKGQRGIRIFGYSTKKVTEENEAGEETEKRIARFPILSVFDIGQTDLIEGATDHSSIAERLTGLDDHGILETLTGYLAGEGWSVERRELVGGKNGYAEPATHTVVIDSDLSPEAASKTALHETAHVLMGHTENPADYAEHRGIRETEAESVAYVVAGLAGFDTSAYSIGYVAGWSNADTELIKSTAARVLATAHRIAGILNPDDTDEDDE